MVLVFIERSNTFTVDKQYFERLALIHGVQELSPAPQALRTRVDCWTYAEATLLTRVDNDPVEQE